MTLGKLVGWLILILVISAPVTMQLAIESYRKLRGRPSHLTRAEQLAKYRYLAWMCAVMGVVFSILLLPWLAFPRRSAWPLLGLPVAWAWFFFGPKPTKPPGHLPPVPATPETGQGIILTRQEDPFLIVSLPVYIDHHRVGTIRSGQTRTYELPPGTHTLHLKPGRGTWGSTPAKTTTIDSHSWSYFECGETTENFRLSFLRHPEQQIWLSPTIAPDTASTR